MQRARFHKSGRGVVSLEDRYPVLIVNGKENGSVLQGRCAWGGDQCFHGSSACSVAPDFDVFPFVTHSLPDGGKT
jgi:hypothetical protein